MIEFHCGTPKHRQIVRRYEGSIFRDNQHFHSNYTARLVKWWLGISKTSARGTTFFGFMALRQPTNEATSDQPDWLKGVEAE